MKNERSFEGIWIPAEVWLSKTLTMQEKIFFVEIKSLDNKDGCFAGNQYFADFFSLSKRRCIAVIKSLIDKGFIESHLKYRAGTRQVEKRILRVSKAYRRKFHGGGERTFITPGEENFTTPMNIPSSPPCRILHHPGEENFTDNSTSNNTINSTSYIADFKKSADGSPVIDGKDYVNGRTVFELDANEIEKEKNSAKKEKAARLIDDAVQLVQYFNELAGRSFPSNKSGRGADNVKYVADLLKKGYTVDELETMIQFKVWEWKDDPKMAKYLQPITIFKRHGKTYIEEALEAKKNPNFLAIVKKAKQHNDEKSSRTTQPLVSADTQRKLLEEYIAEQQQRNGGKY